MHGSACGNAGAYKSGSDWVCLACGETIIKKVWTGGFKPPKPRKFLKLDKP